MVSQPPAVTAAFDPAAEAEAETIKLLELERQEARVRGRNGILNFVTYINPRYQISRHHLVAARLLNAFVAGKIKRLIIIWPPRHGKSELVSRALPAYLLGRNPDMEVMAASYSATLAHAMNRDVQRIIMSPQYRELFPATQLNEKNVRSDAKSGWVRNSEIFEVVGFGGKYRCAGVGGAFTGSGADAFIVDDPLKNWEDASSETKRDKHWDWWTSVLTTRLSKDGIICLATTRWNDDDIAGRLMKLGAADPEADQYTVLHMPALQDNPPNAYDPRERDEALWPERYPATRLKTTKRNNPRVFAALYQGRPTPQGGLLVEEGWWKFVRKSEIPFAGMQWWRISCDLNFEEDQKNDPTVMQVWGGLGADRYCIDQVRAPAGFVEQCAMLMELKRLHPYVQGTLVERAANGAALISVMRSQFGGIIGVAPVGSKYSRAESCAPQIQAGNVYLLHPDDSAWTPDVILEWSQFPAGKHDDQVDATSQVLNFMREETSDELIIPLRQKTSRWKRKY